MPPLWRYNMSSKLEQKRRKFMCIYCHGNHVREDVTLIPPWILHARRKNKHFPVMLHCSLYKHPFYDTVPFTSLPIYNIHVCHHLFVSRTNKHLPAMLYLVYDNFVQFQYITNFWLVSITYLTSKRKSMKNILILQYNFKCYAAVK